MVEHTEEDPVDGRNGDLANSAKTVLDTVMRIIQFLLVAMAAGAFLIAGISLHFPFQLAFKVIAGGVIGAVFIQVIYFFQLSQ